MSEVTLPTSRDERAGGLHSATPARATVREMRLEDIDAVLGLEASAKNSRTPS